MEPFIDYYKILGVPPDASDEKIKEAFRTLAKKYHPDVNKSQGAYARFIAITKAYEVLSNLEQRHLFDSEHARHQSGARNTRQGTAFYAPRDELPNRFVLNGIPYTLSPSEVRMLQQEGMLRGRTLEVTGQQTSNTRNTVSCRCHRCYHRWTPARSATLECPSCKAKDWTEYLLMYCHHCHALFESKQIRYGKRYGHPYELYPLCPHCHGARWCPAEESRLQAVRQAAAETEEANLQAARAKLEGLRKAQWGNRLAFLRHWREFFGRS